MSKKLSGYAMYKIMAGQYTQTHGKVRRTFKVGSVVKIANSEAVRMGIGSMVMRVGDAEGKVKRRVPSAPSKMTIPPKRENKKIIVPNNGRVVKKKLAKKVVKKKVPKLTDEALLKMMTDRGAGHFVLSNGTKVRGVNKALKAQREISTVK